MKLRRKTLASTALLLLLTAGCGAGNGAGGSPSPTATPDPRDAALAYAQCMRDQGIPMKDPSGDDGVIAIEPDRSASFEKLRAAQEACKDKAPRIGNGPDGTDPQIEERMLKFARCMREHGIDLPDPGDEGSVQIPKEQTRIDPQSEKFQAAQRACREFFRPVGSSGGSR